MSALRDQLHALTSELLARRPAMLEAWRNAGEPGGRSAGSSLSRAQFNDHVPAVLDCLAHTLEASLLDDDPDVSSRLNSQVCEHGLQRWQQGYQLHEVVREWGHLQMCVAEELERYAAAHPSLDPRVMPAARSVWMRLCADGVTESATQYWRLHQAESAGHVHDLEQALSAIHNMERSRAEAWRTAAHDLRGSVTVVKGATDLLDSAVLPGQRRTEVADMLSKSVSSLHDMLDDLLGLARLEAGHEQREITSFDAAALMRDFCTASQAAATERGLFLKAEGPDSLPVQGDRTKILRILQNLLLNALKYTERGGVRLTWSADHGGHTDRWTFSVQDTGPGMDRNDVAPIAHELREATDIAQETTEKSTGLHGDIAPAVTLLSASAAQTLRKGEGIGLTIVKRLCELLDAGLELATEPGRGSTLRVILPRAYDSVA